MSGASHSIGEEIRGVLVFVGAIWVAYFVDVVVFPVKFTGAFGLTPRTLHGLIGIPAMPFLHAGLDHLLGNTVPLFVLLVLLAGSRARTWEIVGAIILLGRRPAVALRAPTRARTHVGASGLVFGLIAFLIVSGILERRIIPMLISALVAFLYGGTLLSGILPLDRASPGRAISTAPWPASWSPSHWPGSPSRGPARPSARRELPVAFGKGLQKSRGKHQLATSSALAGSPSARATLSPDFCWRRATPLSTAACDTALATAADTRRSNTLGMM